MNREPYRDNDGVLHCMHHQKLHAVCPQCQQLEEEEPVLLEKLMFWAVFGTCAGMTCGGLLFMFLYIFGR